MLMEGNLSANNDSLVIIISVETIDNQYFYFNYISAYKWSSYHELFFWWQVPSTCKFPTRENQTNVYKTLFRIKNATTVYWVGRSHLKWYLDVKFLSNKIIRNSLDRTIFIICSELHIRFQVAMEECQQITRCEEIW